ncbi:eCIS core domain-containing protein [Mucilaginibacter xinganensis]|uniref:eCIS core domain-containing protein n=1 Tax=Mucilaginibacter xinganensis TaxID=1234841 RepID=A0A223NVL2_9SPHI|nr:DUF4157 domain-containing protein [Mucilaginibacter xinganensis]ASU33915.1 hypothetical protein MuYL_2023 [Mucilaginibacter xinganensis]
MRESTSISNQPQSSPAALANEAVHLPEEQLDLETELNERLPIQLKLSVGAADDPLEYEADAMADKVMRMPETSFIQRKSAFSCGDYDDEHIRLKPLASQITPFIQAKGNGARAVSEAVSGKIQSSMGGGSPMQTDTKSFMESRFGADFSNVKIHNGGESTELNRSLNAKAFTISNNIYFNSGQYHPETDSGKHLLAHELTHVIQQGQAAPAQIQRIPEEKVTETITEDTVILEDELSNQPAGGLYPGILLKGYLKIELLNLPPEKTKLFLPPEPKPVRIKNSDEMHFIDEDNNAPPVSPPPNELKIQGPKKAIVLRVTRRISIKTNNGVVGNVSLRAQTTLTRNFEITKKSPRSIVNQLLNYPFGTSSISILLNETFPGNMPESADPINDQQVTSLNDIIHTYAPDLTGYDQDAQHIYDAAIKLMLAYVPHSAIALDDPNRKIQGKEFKTLDEAKKAAAAMRKKDLMIVQTADGKFHLYELTQMDLFRITNELRNNEGNDPKIDWRKLPDKVKLEKLYINGNEVDGHDVADNYFYVDPDAAATGHGKSLNSEAIIYKTRSSGFFARKPVSHDDALALWKKIDEQIEFPENIAKAYQMPEGQFVALNVKGKGKFHSIDADYVEGKRLYFKNVDEYKKDVKRVTPDKQEYTPLMYDIYKETGGGKLLAYIEAQLDHGAGEDYNFRQTAQGSRPLQSSLTLVVLNRLNNEAAAIAINILNKIYSPLKALIDSDDALRNLLLSFPKMDAKTKRDVISMMGVPDDRKDIYYNMFSDPETASQIAFGISVKTVGFNVLRSSMKTVAADTAKIIEQIKSGDFEPLRVEGEFGNMIRDQVYKNNGFTKIKGNTFPHHDETKGFMPEPLAGSEYAFSGMMEQIYANTVANMDDAMLVLKIGIITLTAIVTAAIVVVSGGIGAGVAAAFFEAGTTAFAVTEVVVSAAAMTVMTEGLNQAMGQGALGKDKAYYGFGDLAKSFGENLVLSGIFSGLGRIMKNAAAVYRLSATTGAFLGYSLFNYYRENKKLPQGRDLYLFIYENLVTLAAVEAGSTLARPLIESFYAKGLDARVAMINGKITGLKQDIILSQKKLATMTGKGSISESEGLKLIIEQRVLLERQQKILTELRDAKEISTDINVNEELRKVEEALEKIRLVEFQRAIDFKQNQFASDKIAYKPGQASVDEIMRFYGKENVSGPDKEGMIEVKLTDGSKLVFYPDTKESAINRTILERPAVKLAVDNAHSINVNWNNINNIPSIKILEGPGTPIVSAKDFWDEKGPNLYDVVYEGKYYLKYDPKDGRLLIGDAQSGEILGFYLDDARNYKKNAFAKILINDPVKDIPAAAEKLKVYHGLTGNNAPLKGIFSSGARIVADPNKTTTIIGAFRVVDGKVEIVDMPQLFDNFGNLKNADFGAKKGGFNVLNVGEGFYEPGTFFDNYNRPWLLEAIKRGDNFYSASDPTKEIFIYERNKVTNDWIMVTDPNTGIAERKLTGFGKEVKILNQNGYHYDPATKMFIK